MTKHSTSIEWTHRPGTKGERWNMIRAQSLAHPERIGWHCEHVTEACRNCYAETWNKSGHFGGTKLPYKPGHRKDLNIYVDEKTLLQPLHWKEPRTIFVCSMTDLFGEWVSDEWLDRIFAVMALCPQHIFIALTKRPERMRAYCATKPANLSTEVLTLAQRDEHGYFKAVPAQWPLPNVWLGTSVCDQPDADKAVPHLLETPSAIHFISYEPALGPVDFTAIDSKRQPEQYESETINALTGQIWWELDGRQHEVLRTVRQQAHAALDWIICGGESGPSARPMHPDWARGARDQCAAAGVAYFLKQWGEWAHSGLAEDDPDIPLDWREQSDRFRCMRPDGTFVSGLGGRREEFMARIGKKRAGRLLDGVEHNGFPDVASLRTAA